MKKRIIVTLDELTSECPYFYDSDTNVNNGYNCAHPKCGEKDKADTKYFKGCEIGRCHTFTCPLAIEAEEEDFADESIEKDEDYLFSEGEFMIVEVEEENENDNQ